MKSGLYLTEIVRRLFASVGLKRAFPDENERIMHILEKQIYGMAPTEIIYRIATNFILGFDLGLGKIRHNLVLGDAVKYAKAGQLAELVARKFGGEKGA